MIAANGATARFLEAQRLPVAPPGAARSPSAGTGSSTLAARLGETLPDAPDAPALQAFLLQAAGGGPRALPRPLALGRQAARLRRVRRRGARAADRRPLRPGGEGLHALDRAEPPLPRPRDAAAASRPRSPALRAAYPSTSSRELARHCTEQEDDAAKVERQVVKSAAALLLAPPQGRALRRHRHGRVARRAPGCASSARRSRAGWSAARKASTSASACACELVDTDVERGFIDFARA